ncbi:MAG: hypothetical protein DWQ01_18180 [Planctomycetota bacterium]|nr:MAG: hypothetical protein DWQ01_18180 [Planctomycetota bacterium]
MLRHRSHALAIFLVFLFQVSCQFYVFCVEDGSGRWVEKQHLADCPNEPADHHHDPAEDCLGPGSGSCWDANLGAVVDIALSETDIALDLGPELDRSFFGTVPSGSDFVLVEAWPQFWDPPPKAPGSDIPIFSRERLEQQLRVVVLTC